MCGVHGQRGVGDNSGFTPGLAACSRIWGVCAPDVGTLLCAAGWLIFITAHNDGAREWGLGWKRHGETKERRAAKERERERERGGGPKITEGRGRDKGNSEAEKLCFLLIHCPSEKGRSVPQSRPQTVKCNCGAVPALIRAKMVQSYMLLEG